MFSRLRNRFRLVFLGCSLLMAITALGWLSLQSPGGQPLKPAAAEPLIKSWTDRIDRIKKHIDTEAASLETLYKYLHAHPELSFQEEQAAAVMAKELTKVGFEVTAKVGGHGVVAVLKNGPGATVLVRTDMDALPVTETTGLPYASKVRVRDKDGREVGVMHACGHDMH